MGRRGDAACPLLCPLPLDRARPPTCGPWGTVNVLPVGESDSAPEDKDEGDLLPCAKEGRLLNLDASDSKSGQGGGVGNPDVLSCNPGESGAISSLSARDSFAPPPTVGDSGPKRGGSKDDGREAGRGPLRSPAPATAGVEVARGE